MPKKIKTPSDAMRQAANELLLGFDWSSSAAGYDHWNSVFKAICDGIYQQENKKEVANV